MDTAIWNGLAQGLKEGLVSYRQADEQRAKREAEDADRRVRQRAQDMDLAEKGYEVDPQTQKVVLTEAGKRKQASDARKAALEMRIKGLSILGSDAVGTSEYDRVMNDINQFGAEATGAMPPQGASPMPGQSGISFNQPEQPGLVVGGMVPTGLVDAGPSPRPGGISFKPGFKKKEQRQAEQRRDDKIFAAELAQQMKDASPTSEKAKAGTFATRTRDAEAAMDALKKSGFDRTSAAAGMESTAAKIPVIGAAGKLMGLIGSDAQTQNQAELDFLSAVLRKESGAQISPSEYAIGNEMYFDRTGDSPEVRKRKAESRANAVAALEAEAGDKFLGNINRRKTKNAALKNPGIPDAEWKLLSDSEKKQLVEHMNANRQ
jgi:hypothetical protein